MYIRQLTNEEFTKFATYFPIKSPYQTAPYAIALNTENYDSMFLGLINDSNSVVAATLVIINKIHGFKYAYAPRGFLIDFNDTSLLKIFTEEIKKFLSKEEVVAIKVNPMIIRNVYNFKYQVTYTNPNFDNNFSTFKSLGFIHLGFNDFFEALKPRFEAVIDIDKSPILLFKGLRKEFKTKVRSAEANGVRIYRGNAEDLDMLYNQIKMKYSRGLPYFRNLFHNFSKTNSIELYYSKLDSTIHLKHIQDRYVEQESFCAELSNDILSANTKNSNATITKKMIADKALVKEKEKLVKATNYLKEFPDGVITSSCLVIKQGTTVYLFIDGFDPVYKRFNSKHLMIWKLIEKFSKMGYTKFNLGGLSNYIQGKTHMYMGLNNFKLGFGSNVHEYIGDFELVTNRARYIMYRNIIPLKSITKSKLNK